MSKLIKDSFLVVGTKVASLVLGLVSSIFVIRLLGPEGKGDLTLLEVGVSMLFLSTTFNANISIVHFVAQKKMALSKLLGFVIFLLFCSVGTAAVVVLFLKLIGRENFVIPNDNQYLFIGLFLFLLFVTEIKEFLSAFLRGGKSFEDLYKSTMLYAVFRLVLFGGLYALFYFGDVQFSKFSVIGFHVLTIVFITVSIYRFYRKTFDVTPDFRFTFQEVKPFLVFSVLGLITAILNFLSLKMDIWFVEAYMSDVELGYYAFALGLGEMVSQVPASLRTVLLPYLSGAKNKKERLQTLTFFSKITCTSTLLIAVLLFVIAPWLVPFLYTDVFVPAVVPFQIILFAMVIFAFKAIFVMYNVSRERQRYNVWSNAIGLFSLIPLCLWLIPSYGIVGGAYAVIISYTLSALYIFGNVLVSKELPFVNYFFVTVSDIKNLKQFVNSRFLKK